MSINSKNKQISTDTHEKPINGLLSARQFFDSKPVSLSIPEVAKIAGVSKVTAYNDIKKIKPSPRFRAKVKKLYGCVPWE